MAAFLPSVSLEQSADGSTVIITDVSNYSTNSDGVLLANIISRTDVIQDGLGNAIATVVFVPGSLTATVTITKDYYMNNTLSFVIPGPVTKIAIENFDAFNFYRNAAREVSRKLRCCNCNNLCNSAVKADLAFTEAETAYQFGVPSESQNAIDDANALINSEDCLC
jgi:hypothetical protein